MKQKRSALILLTFLLVLLFAACNKCTAQDTTKAEICYSYTDCQIKDSTFAAVYNSHCIEIENGYIIENEYGSMIFLNSKKHIFTRNIIVWYYKKQK